VDQEISSIDGHGSLLPQSARRLASADLGGSRLVLRRKRAGSNRLRHDQRASHSDRGPPPDGESPHRAECNTGQMADEAARARKPASDGGGRVGRRIETGMRPARGMLGARGRARTERADHAQPDNSAIRGKMRFRAAADERIHP
jgi:hypothetical protein